ncbi:HutD family protein [Enterobacteriaceae bacterium Kacie_13]|nr:HutD family protein [Enterobacteriaceae bacterium Kacie_13]
MTGWQPFSFLGLPVSPWRNGGGETREIIRVPAGNADFDWRASIATIAQDGPFSIFPGIDRSITLLSGEGVHLLAAPDIDHSLNRAGEPFSFHGEQAVSARLLGSVTTDFNIMTRRETCRAKVIAARETLTISPQHGGVIYILSGHWQLPDGMQIGQGDGFYWTGNARINPVTVSTKHPDGLLLWASIITD